MAQPTPPEPTERRKMLETAWRECKEEFAWLACRDAPRSAYLEIFNRVEPVSYTLRHLDDFRKEGFDLSELYRAGLTDDHLKRAGIDPPSTTDPIADIAKLYRAGLLTEEGFARAKANPPPAATRGPVLDMEYCCILALQRYIRVESAKLEERAAMYSPNARNHVVCKP